MPGWGEGVRRRAAPTGRVRPEGLRLFSPVDSLTGVGLVVLDQRGGLLGVNEYRPSVGSLGKSCATSARRR